MSEVEELEAKLAGLKVVGKAEERFSEAKAAHLADTSDPKAKAAYDAAGEALAAARAEYREAEVAAGRRVTTAGPVEVGVEAMNGGQS